jgi:hypothetical protein
MKSKQTEKVGIYRQLPPRDPHTKKTKVHIESQSNGSAHQLSNYPSEISTRFFYVAQMGLTDQWISVSVEDPVANQSG